MKVELTGFSQGVSLHNTDETVNYLDFRRDDGRLFRVPISAEALDGLMQEIYGVPEAGMAEEAPSEVPEAPPEADVFGGDDFPTEPEEEDLPESEEAIRSL